MNVKVALFLLAWLLPPALSAGAGQPVVRIENPGQCIAPPDEMRRTHMDMLKHQRDRSVRLGLRDEPASLNGCIVCHASKTTGSVLGPEGFCQSCHSYVAVRLDCWDCHQARPGIHRAAGAKP